jgi:hypothetical protein
MLYSNPYLEQCLEGPFSLFRDLPDKEKEFLLQDHVCTSLKKGEIIFHEGGRPSGLTAWPAARSRYSNRVSVAGNRSSGW